MSVYGSLNLFTYNLITRLNHKMATNLTSKIPYASHKSDIKRLKLMWHAKENFSESLTTGVTTVLSCALCI